MKLTLEQTAEVLYDADNVYMDGMLCSVFDNTDEDDDKHIHVMAVDEEEGLQYDIYIEGDTELKGNKLIGTDTEENHFVLVLMNESPYELPAAA